MNSDPLIPIWQAYLVVIDSLKISKRVVRFSNNASEALNAFENSETSIIGQLVFEKHKVGLNLLNRCKMIDQVNEATFQHSSTVIIENLKS